MTVQLTMPTARKLLGLRLREAAFWTIVAWLAFASWALGARPYDAVCRISAPLTATTSAGGSGTLYWVGDGQGRIVTAAHVIEGCRGGITATFTSTGERLNARVIKVDTATDLAVLAVAKPRGIEPPYGLKVPTKEDGPFVRVGYPYYSQKQEWNRGRYFGFPKGQGTSAHAQSMLHVSGTVVSGFSGGAVFTKEGYLCGVISGNTSNDMSGLDRTWGCGGKTLVDFCQSCCPGRGCPVFGYPGYRPPQQQPQRPSTPGTPPPVQPSQPTPSAIDTDKLKTEILVAVDAKLDGIECECDPSSYATHDELDALAAQVLALQQTITQINEQCGNLAEQLDHNTPIRVYTPNGTLVGEAQTNLFRGGSIDFTFDPRTLLGQSQQQQ